MKKELLEIKRTLTIDRYNITRITGYIVDNDRNCRLEFVKNFLNLEETETFKYLDILKKVLSGKPGRNMFQLNFKEKTRKQHLNTIVKTGLEDNDVRQIFLEEIAESIGILNKEYSLILIASGIYDIPGIATDGANLDESEEVYEYMIGCICPVSLSAAGLSYKPELADIQERTRDWVVSMPTQGFLYPAFTDRHEDPEHIWYYSKVPDKPDAGLITQTLRCGMPSTPKEQKEAFREGLNAADGKVSLEQAKDIYHYLGRIREIKAESNNRILKGAELENVLKSIGIDPELAAEKTKDCDAAEIDADNTVSTKTFGTGQGFFADFIVAGTMLADRIKGGTLELGGAGNGNGVAKVLNADGNEIVRLDKDGVYAKGKYVCANTDGSQTATLSNGNLTFKTESYEVVIRAGAIGGLTGLMIYPEQGAVRTKFLSIGDKLSARFDNISLLASGKTTIGGASLEVQRDGKGYSGKTGKAVFSDGTYLEYVNGFLVGGNTKEGGF